MVRPKKPATNTTMKIYRRLEESSLWLGDYSSTGLGRTTVSKALQYYFSKGLITKRQDGRKTQYDFYKGKTMVDWWPLINNQRNIVKLRQVHSDTKQWVKDSLDTINAEIDVVASFANISKEASKNVEINLSNKEILAELEKIDPDMSYKEMLVYWKEIMELQYCPNCLQKSHLNTTIKNANGEITCKTCGLVLARDNYTNIAYVYHDDYF